jgi:glutathione synthase/RimK-type ligase-like ATP-grasp enzyme
LGNATLYFGKESKSFCTYRINKKKFEKLLNNKDLYYPVFIQEEIKKDFELRINIIGNQIYACKIKYSKEAGNNVDWRTVDTDHLGHISYELPEDLKTKLFSLCRKLNLQFGAVDMAVTPEGKYVFFEINPNGQYLWIEDKTGQPLSEAMANLLAEPEKYGLH